MAQEAFKNTFFVEDGMFRSIRNWFRNKRLHQSALRHVPFNRRKRRFRMSCPTTEHLESRTLLTVTVGFTETFGILSVRADADGDVVLISVDGENILVNGAVILSSDSGVPASLLSVNQVDVRGDAVEDEANDFRVLDDLGGAISVILQGGGGDDILVGNSGSDLLLGQRGNDDIRGNGGDDMIDGGPGNDTLVGGFGMDTITGDIGDDDIFGEGGNDTINGGNGNDTIQGGHGDDMIDGAAGNDLLFGQLGNDTLDGGPGDDGYGFEGGMLGDDVINEAADAGEDFLDFTNFAPTGSVSVGVDIHLAFTTQQTVHPGELNLTLQSATAIEIVIGSAFNDDIDGNTLDNFLFGGPGDDEITGAAGSDFLFGLDGDDMLFGAGGQDTLNGGNGTDLLVGGGASDTYSFNPDSESNDTIRDQSSDPMCSDHDVLDFSEMTAGVTVDLSSTAAQEASASIPFTLTLTGAEMIEDVIGSSHADFVLGNACGNVLSGGAGDDILNGAAGMDTLNGEAGNDSLDGGTGDDMLDGGDNDDTFLFFPDWGTDQVMEAASGGTDGFEFNLTSGVDVELGSVSATDGANTATHNDNNIESVRTGSGDDRFFVQPGFLLGPELNLIDGAGGADTLSYVLHSQPIEIDLGTDTAPGIIRFQNLELFIGSASDEDTVLGPDEDTNWLISGPNTTEVGDATYESFERLIGGSQADLLVVAAGGSLSDGFGGGEGVNTLETPGQRVTVSLTGVEATGTLHASEGQLASFNDIHIFVGDESFGGNEVVGISTPTNWLVSGENEFDMVAEGTTLIFNAFSAITAGTSDDTFIFSDGARLTGFITEFGGHDTVDYSQYTTPVGFLPSGGSAYTTGFQFLRSTDEVVDVFETVIGGSAADDLRTPGLNLESDRPFELIGNAGDDFLELRVSGRAGIFHRLDGGEGNDTYTIIPVGPTSAMISDSAGSGDTLIVHHDRNKTIDLDSGSMQTITTEGDGLLLQGVIENLTLTGDVATADTVMVGPLDDAQRTIRGGNPVAAPGDTLILDFMGASLNTVGFSESSPDFAELDAEGFAKVLFTEFEHYDFVNFSGSAPGSLGVTVESGTLKISDTTPGGGTNDIIVTVDEDNRVVNVVDNLNRVQTDVGRAFSPVEVQIPYSAFGGQIEIDLGPGDDSLKLDSSAGTFDIIINGGDGDDTLDRSTDFSSGTVDVVNIETTVGSSGGTIGGRKWHDSNGDGVKDDNEPGLNGWIIEVLNEDGDVVESAITADNDVNNDNVIDPTNESGFYSINLPEGKWWIREVQQIGWQQTFPVVDALKNEAFSLDRSFDLQATQSEFENWGGLGEKWFYSLLNREWWFVVPDGGVFRWDRSERENLTGSKVGQLDSTYHRDISRIHAAANPGVVAVDIVSSQTTNDVSFGNVALGAIEGRKWNDLNADGVRDANEPWLNGWTINLEDDNGNVVGTVVTADRDLNNDQQIDPETEAGWYLFEQLGSGSFVVSEEEREGWTQTFPNQQVAQDALDLDQTLNLRATKSDFRNWGSLDERWFLSDQGWHYIMPNGEVFKWDDSPRTALTGTRVATLSAEYWENLERIHDAVAPGQIRIRVGDENVSGINFGNVNA